jgi:hypothetical protein
MTPIFQTIQTDRSNSHVLKAPGAPQVAAGASRLPPIATESATSHPPPHLCRNDPSLHRRGKKRPAPDRYQARITENPSRSYLARDSAGTPASTIIPSTSVMAAITYGEAAFNFSAETNT